MNKKYIQKNYINLCSPVIGTKIYEYSDQFFGLASRLLKDEPPVFKDGVYDKNGKWMDGWETRRKRNKGHDYLILKLGRPGKIHKVDIDTSYFNGNQPNKVSLDACYSKNKLPGKNSRWINILKKSTTKPNSHHFFNIKNKSIFTHVKLNIYPDGGVARIRIYGEMKINKKFGKKITNLTSVLSGATPIACNNEHFGRAENVLAPGAGKNMGDGWETRRSRGKNFDWLILKCATAGKINKIQIDTHHFKGNYPDKCSVQAAYLNNQNSPKSIVNKSKNWKLLLGKVKLHAHKKHNFNNKLMKNKNYSSLARSVLILTLCS